MRLRKAEYVSSLLDIPRPRLYELVRRGYFPPGVVIKLGARQLRFNDGALRTWIAAGGGLCFLASGDSQATAIGR